MGKPKKKKKKKKLSFLAPNWFGNVEYTHKSAKVRSRNFVLGLLKNVKQIHLDTHISKVGMGSPITQFSRFCIFSLRVRVRLLQNQGIK